MHEANHHRYLERRGMLGKPEPAQIEFEKKHRCRMEILAHEEEIRFLQRAGRNSNTNPRTRSDLLQDRDHQKLQT